MSGSMDGFLICCWKIQIFEKKGASLGAVAVVVVQSGRQLKARVETAIRSAIRRRGCERGSAYEFEIRQDLLQLMTCGQRNVLQFAGICIEESNGLCVVTRMMDGGSVHDLIRRSRKMGPRPRHGVAALDLI